MADAVYVRDTKQDGYDNRAVVAITPKAWGCFTSGLR
ncbi:MAG: DUF397 domain-containing protein [Streptosporangiales bacterium]|nr:DUF397 domain-containing protein [Streptosporangiales bacterium]